MSHYIHSIVPALNQSRYLFLQLLLNTEPKPQGLIAGDLFILASTIHVHLDPSFFMIMFFKL